MGAEVGATTSLFPFDGRMATYLRATGRDRIVELAEAVDCELRADQQVTDEPEKYYDRVIDIDLSTLEPYINGPFTPDAATPISEFAEKVLLNGYPRKMEVGLIGSCTNSSLPDLQPCRIPCKAGEGKESECGFPADYQSGFRANPRYCRKRRNDG